MYVKSEGLRYVFCPNIFPRLFSTRTFFASVTTQIRMTHNAHTQSIPFMDLKYVCLSRQVALFANLHVSGAELRCEREVINVVYTRHI